MKRRTIPEELIPKTTSVRLNTKQREMFKFLGGNAWLKSYLDDYIKLRKIAKDFVS